MAINIEPFKVKDCALVAIATGEKAHGIRELKDILYNIHTGSIYYHFWGMLLKPSFINREYNNEFAMWVKKSLHDSVLAERLAILDPTDFENIDGLRRELIEVIEERIDESESISWIKPDRLFYFKRSHIVVFDTSIIIDSPEDLCAAVKKMTPSGIFYHFIDARRRTPDGLDDFREWLNGFEDKYKDVIDKIAQLDPYFVSLSTLREQLISIFSDFFGGGCDE